MKNEKRRKSCAAYFLIFHFEFLIGSTSLTLMAKAATLLAIKNDCQPCQQTSVRTEFPHRRRTPRQTDTQRRAKGFHTAHQARPAHRVLRVAVVGGGCSGLQYKMDLQDGPASRDILVESGGVRVVVDPKSALYVTGSELDYIEALQDGGFKVKNPNAATSCSCGESFNA
jgi:iron-sulfur cluster assembly accessory protein